MNIFIGCSGYYYPARKGKFYPSGLATSKWLQHYAEHFNTIEINSTFYRFPTVQSLQKRYKDTPSGFRFSVKAPKLFTHQKKMNNISEDLALFYDVVEQGLAEKSLCILFQYPPSFAYSLENLEKILKVDASRITHVFEFRHISRFRQEVYDALEQAGIVLCNISHPNFIDSYVSTSPIIYLRMHGKEVLFKSAYGKAGLNEWITNIKKETGKDILVYFNNTWYGEAVHDAKIIQKELSGEIF